MVIRRSFLILKAIRIYRLSEMRRTLKARFFLRQLRRALTYTERQITV